MSERRDGCLDAFEGIGVKLLLSAFADERCCLLPIVSTVCEVPVKFWVYLKRVEIDANEVGRKRHWILGADKEGFSVGSSSSGNKNVLVVNYEAIAVRGYVYIFCVVR